MMRQVPLEHDINIAVNGPFWVEVANPEHPFMAMLKSRSCGTCLIVTQVPGRWEIQLYSPWLSRRHQGVFSGSWVRVCRQCRPLCPRGQSGGAHGQAAPLPRGGPWAWKISDFFHRQTGAGCCSQRGKSWGELQNRFRLKVSLQRKTGGWLGANR